MKHLTLLAAALLLVPATLGAAEVCEGFGPQTPRDITSKAGENTRVFEMAPGYETMNLCDIHFHKHAEHKGPGFSVFKGSEDDGGYACNEASSLSKAQMKPMSKPVCGSLQPGDTIEVHWVHSSCDVEPGPTLGTCLADGCEALLRVEAQVFLLVNDDDAHDFADFAYGGHKTDGLHQAKAIPSDTGDPVQFLGSTTGPSYDEKTCSPLEVTWSVRPQCAMLDIASVEEWCEENVFEEDSAQGVRDLVTDVALLSAID